MFTTYDFWVLLIQEGVHGGEPWLLCAFIIFIYLVLAGIISITPIFTMQLLPTTINIPIIK